MKRHEDAPLDAEERALAAQLRRLPPHGEPAPDLDARILAMARTAGGGRRPTPWYRGLPGYASAAAVCVLAAGLAWQLWPSHVQRGEHATAPAPVPLPASKPLVEAPPAPRESANAAADSIGDKASAADAAAVPLTKEIVQPQPPRPAPARAMPPTPQPPIVSSANDAVSYSAPAPVAAPAPVLAPPPAPPAPPAPPPPPPVQSMEAAPAAASAEGAVKPREQPKSAPVTVNAMRAKAAATADTESGYDARPPATVQDTSVRNDWLKRIRELMAQGDRDGARSSLQEYKTRYPDATIPADLQPLLAAPPAKTP